MSGPDNVLDLENPPEFNPDIWIGKSLSDSQTLKRCFQEVPELGDACISNVGPLCTADGKGGSYGFVFVNKQVMLRKGKVLNRC
jgi:hypothetical protein